MQVCTEIPKAKSELLNLTMTRITTGANGEEENVPIWRPGLHIQAAQGFYGESFDFVPCAKRAEPSSVSNALGLQLKPVSKEKSANAENKISLKQQRQRWQESTTGMVQRMRASKETGESQHVKIATGNIIDGAARPAAGLNSKQKLVAARLKARMVEDAEDHEEDEEKTGYARPARAFKSHVAPTRKVQTQSAKAKSGAKAKAVKISLQSQQSAYAKRKLLELKRSMLDVASETSDVLDIYLRISHGYLLGLA